MGRLRARLASHKVDRDAGKYIADSERLLRRAVDSYGALLKTGSESEKKRAARAIGTIKKAMGVLAGVQSVGSRYDLTDPDLVPESQKVSRTRKSKSERVG